MSELVERLHAAPASVNPAVEMSRRIQEMARAEELNPARVKKLLPKINRAIETGHRDLDASRAAFRDLSEAEAIPSKDIPLGF